MNPLEGVVDMELHDYDKAKDLRSAIDIVNGQIAQLNPVSNVESVQMISPDGREKSIDDLKRAIVETRCCKELNAAQTEFIEDIRQVLIDYRNRLERQFNDI